MATNKLKVMLSFMKELDKGVIPSSSDYDLDDNEFWKIIDACQGDGLIKGASYKEYITGDTELFLEETILTVKGMEYLIDKSALMKTYIGLKEFRDWLPF